MSKTDKRAGMAFLTREQILAAAKATRKVSEIEVERLGGSVRLRELTTAEMFDFRKATKKKDDEEAGLYLLAACWVDEDDRPLFAGDDGFTALGSLPLGILEDLTTVVLEVNGLGQKAVEEAGND